MKNLMFVPYVVCVLHRKDTLRTTIKIITGEKILAMFDFIKLKEKNL
jgi:hypothetical protein